MLPDDFKITRVDASSEALLSNLFELYLHDMAEWFLFDSHADGRYSFAVETCWENDGRVFIAWSGELPVGFAVVQLREDRNGGASTQDVKEFFILRRFRRTGAGLALAKHVWDLFHGEWTVRVFGANRPAIPFWRTAVTSYARSTFREEVRSVDGNKWIYFFFASS